MVYRNKQRIFSAGIRSSQRSECTNHAIGFNATQNTSLTEFYGIFKDTVKRWRSVEQQDEFSCVRSHPGFPYEMAGMLAHASEVYTLTLFTVFHKEFMKCISVISTLIGQHDTSTIHTVTSVQGDSCNKVIYDNSLNLITCDCERFEEFGMLCHHSLRILLINYVQRIPDAYIKKDEQKMAKSEVWDKNKGKMSNTENMNNSIEWRHEATRYFYNLVLRCEKNEEARRIIDESNKRNTLAIDALETVGRVDTLTNSESSRTILDPSRSTTKGRGKRIKGYLEKEKKGRVGSSTLLQSKEFGSKTPNPRLL